MTPRRSLVPSLPLLSSPSPNGAMKSALPTASLPLSLVSPSRSLFYCLQSPPPSPTYLIQVIYLAPVADGHRGTDGRGTTESDEKINRVAGKT